MSLCTSVGFIGAMEAATGINRVWLGGSNHFQPIQKQAIKLVASKCLSCGAPMHRSVMSCDYCGGEHKLESK